MYASFNYPTKKALKEAISAGHFVGVYQPNDLYGNTEKVQIGEHEVSLEGPTLPQATQVVCPRARA